MRPLLFQLIDTYTVPHLLCKPVSVIPILLAMCIPLWRRITPISVSGRHEILVAAEYILNN